jgi:hypothetical protein
LIAVLASVRLPLRQRHTQLLDAVVAVVTVAQVCDDVLVRFEGSDACSWWAVEPLLPRGCFGLDPPTLSCQGWPVAIPEEVRWHMHRIISYIWLVAARGAVGGLFLLRKRCGGWLNRGAEPYLLKQAGIGDAVRGGPAPLCVTTIA